MKSMGGLEQIIYSDPIDFVVTVRSGMDMSISEFEQVANVIKEFASEQAIVVIGTVIVPELSDDMQVIIICTGD